ncbi:HDOD domain-containing protein [Nocardioides sp. zg-1228]|uniref:HDOD domain-containing protein n=1 Tax=Nocardioides sp. zg-1228 TaxID=2763008 RepID=UPI0016431BB8|nr:HDOD domain-containing protein [Nocardioides sp. zg-1228]MBC2932084.1 HDOD domain-containing protein [Nocardioides sp. zg-1228]QSF57632.1 HDOD domain-containing protein [Nocardioides sp. zg-1228]
MTTAPLVDQADLLAAAESVEPLPHTIARLATLVADPDSDIREISETVALDVSLAADVLRRANSVALGHRANITSVRDAVVRLGSSTLLSLTMASRVGGRMLAALPAYGLKPGALWERSVAASIAAEVIRSRARVPVPAEAGTAALLHDFGMVVLARHFGNQILDMLALAAATDGLDLVETERRVLGLTHADIGAAVAEAWGLPLTIVDGIREHHEAHEDLSAVSAAVALACAMSHEITTRDEDPEELESQVTRHHEVAPLLQVLQLDDRAYHEIVETSRERFDAVADRYNA